MTRMIENTHISQPEMRQPVTYGLPYRLTGLSHLSGCLSGIFNQHNRLADWKPTREAKTLLPLLLMIITLTGCRYFSSNIKKGEHALARVHNEYLYASEVDGLVPPGTPPADSVAMIKNYVENWVKNRVVLNQAEKNLSAAQKDFSRQLQDYRNSLVIYTYETELIAQRLDTVVRQKEIEEYYQNNRDNFVLRDNIVKMVYIRIHKDSIQPAKTARQFLEADSIRDFDNFEKFCLTRTAAYQVSINNWFLFRDLLLLAPLTTYNEELFLKNNRLIDLTDEQWRYIIRIYNFMTKDAVSPISLEMDNIRAIILNARKLELVKKMRQQALEQAVKNKNIEIF